MFVCLGNICRSPLAEAIFRKKVKDKGLADLFEIQSSGTASYHIGQDADERAKAVAAKHDTPMDHTAQQFNAKKFSHFDYILAMDDANYTDLRKLLDPYGTLNLYKMGYFDDWKSNSDICDPYYGDKEGFEAIYKQLESYCDALLKYIIKEKELTHA